MGRDWFKTVRENKKMTQNNLACCVGVTRQHIGLIENGTAVPSVTVAKKIASILDFDWTKFFEDDRPQIKETG